MKTRMFKGRKQRIHLVPCPKNVSNWGSFASAKELDRKVRIVKELEDASDLAEGNLKNYGRQDIRKENLVSSENAR